MVKNQNYGFSKNCQIWAKKLPPKTSKNCQNGDQNFGFSTNCQIWANKLPPKTSKNCQNGDISPHLVTLLATSEERFYRDPSRLKKVVIKITRVQNRIFQIFAKTNNSQAASEILRAASKKIRFVLDGESADTSLTIFTSQVTKRA